MAFGNVGRTDVNPGVQRQGGLGGGDGAPLVGLAPGPRPPSPVLVPSLHVNLADVDLRLVDAPQQPPEVPLLVVMRDLERPLLGQVASAKQSAAAEAGRMLTQLALASRVQGAELEFCLQHLVVVALRSPDLVVVQSVVGTVVDVLANPLVNPAAAAMIRPVLDCAELVARIAPVLTRGFREAEGVLAGCIIGDLARFGSPLAVDRLGAFLAGGGRLAVGAYVGLLRSNERRAWELVYQEGRRGSVLAIEALLRFKNNEDHRAALLGVDVGNVQSLFLASGGQGQLAVKMMRDLAALGHRRASEIVVSALPEPRTPPRSRVLRQPTYGPQEMAAMSTGLLDGFGRMALERRLYARVGENPSVVLPPFESIRSKALRVIQGEERGRYLAAVPNGLWALLIGPGMEPGEKRAIEDDLVTLLVLDRQLRQTGTTVLDLILRAVEANRARPVDGTLNEANARAFLPAVLDSYDAWIRVHRGAEDRVLMSAEVVGTALMDREWHQPLSLGR